MEKIGHYVEHLQSLKYNYGKHYLPHDADNETLASRSVKKILSDAYPGEGKIKVVPRVAKKEHGIRAAREIFDFCNFDEDNTSEGWQCLCRYQYEVNEKTQLFSKTPLHNEYSDGADAFQTFALSLKSEAATKLPPKKEAPKVISLNRQTTGWMSSL